MGVGRQLLFFMRCLICSRFAGGLHKARVVLLGGVHPQTIKPAVIKKNKTVLLFIKFDL